jgi:hypothetical protein
MDNEKLFIVLNFIINNNFPLIDNPDHLPENIGFREYLSIIDYLDKKEYIESIENDAHFDLTDVGVANLKLIQENLEQKNLDTLAERKKLHNESVMSGWKRKTFWYIFALGLFGGIYSGIDLFNKITDKKEVQTEQLTKQEMKEELSRLRTLILTKKKRDSLMNSNSELNR